MTEYAPASSGLFNRTSTPEMCPLPLHVSLPISMADAAFTARLDDLLKNGNKVMVHGEELGDRIVGIMGGYIRWAGLIGIVQNDIKRVVAYSTLSQLGYMIAALGASAYAAGLFHLMTHAFFKALLFLGAGSVIIALHHEQDMRHMGGLRKYMPVTWITAWIGTLALIGFPGSAGFFSKDLLIEAIHESHWEGQGAVYWIAYLSVLLGVFVTALYSFRMFFLVFHGEGPRQFEPHHDVHDAHGDAETQEEHPVHDEPRPHESPWVVTVPLILLAIPSVISSLLPTFNSVSIIPGCDTEDPLRTESSSGLWRSPKILPVTFSSADILSMIFSLKFCS
mgnify:CR=1 FL=1